MKKSNLILAIASGVVLSLALPRPGLWVASWLGLALLLAAVRRTTVSSAALLGLVTGAVYFAVILYWLTLFGCLPWVLVALFQALFITAFAASTSALSPQRIGVFGYVAVPAAWTALQWVRSLGLYGFTWGSFAHTQASVTPLIQIASLTGPWAIDFLVCLVNLSLADLAWPHNGRRRVYPAAVAALVTVAVVALGHFSVGSAATDGRVLRAAVVQASLTHAVNPPPGYSAEAFRVYRDMTLVVANSQPDIVVWPETVLIERVTGSHWDKMLSQTAVESGAVLVVGGYDAPADPAIEESYNAAHVYGPDGRKLGVYRKVHLVPYGEFVPLRDRLAFLRNYGIRAVDVLPGEHHSLIDIGVGKLGIGICFESLFPQIASLQTREGAGLLVVITNDSWFGQTQAAVQHLMMAKLRAVENRRYLLRAASTGVSAVIDPCGRVVSEMSLFERGAIVEEVRFREGLTPYARFGDWFAYMCVVIAVVSLFASPGSRGRKSL